VPFETPDADADSAVLAPNGDGEVMGADAIDTPDLDTAAADSAAPDDVETDA